MRWTLISIFAAIALIVLGFYAVGADNMNISEKATYWFCVVAFLTAQGFRLIEWVHEHDL